MSRWIKLWMLRAALVVVAAVAWFPRLRLLISGTRLLVVTARRPPSPIRWSSVMFLHASHRGLTSDPMFTDNVLALPLESPR